MRIALVHDYISEFGGAERVLQVLHEIWPEAPIYTAFYRKDSVAGRVFSDAKIIESRLAPLIKYKNLYSPLRFLAPLIWKSFDLADYDLVIASSSWYITRGFKVGEKTKVICYCHTPPRYLYGYPTALEWQKYKLVKLYALVVNHFLRQFDYQSAQVVDEFVVNSENVRKRVKKFYRREATVIYPPVEIGEAMGPPKNAYLLPRLTASRRKGASTGQAVLDSSSSRHPSLGYFLCVSRLAGAKNIDLAIKAANQLKLPLWIVGSGREEKHLKSIAGPTIKFLGQVSDQKLREIYKNCRAFLALAADEDFGITPVEAMAVGKPVIAFRGGGYLETVVEGKTGVFFDELRIESLIKAIKKLSNLEIKKEDCVRQAKKFSQERFKKEIKELAKKSLEDVRMGD